MDLMLISCLNETTDQLALYGKRWSCVEGGRMVMC